MKKTAPRPWYSQPELATYLKYWNEHAVHPAKSLLRLAILRDLCSAIHALKSRQLGQHKKKAATTLWALEQKCQSLRHADLTNVDLITALSAPLSPIEKPEPELNLPGEIGKKLFRPDRQWEATIVKRGLILGWDLWHCEATIDVHSAEAFHANLSERLFPDAIVLFVESIAQTPPASQWSGRWFLLGSPTFTPPTLDVTRNWGKTETKCALNAF